MAVTGKSLADHIIEHEILGFVSGTTSSGISGVSDHGDLDGLSDDDHIQYYNSARLTSVLAGYSPTNHTHPEFSELENLILEVSGLITAGGVTDHGALTGLADDDHPQYLTEARLEPLLEPLEDDLLSVSGLLNNYLLLDASNGPLTGPLTGVEGTALDPSFQVSTGGIYSGVGPWGTPSLAIAASNGESVHIEPYVNGAAVIAEALFTTVDGQSFSGFDSAFAQSIYAIADTGNALLTINSYAPGGGSYGSLASVSGIAQLGIQGATRSWLYFGDGGTPSLVNISNATDQDTGLLFNGGNTFDLVASGLYKLRVSNTALTTAANVLPDFDSTRDIGSNSIRYSNIYADNFHGAISGYSLIGHTHVLADITDYVAPDLSGYATTAEVITISGFLQTEIDGKSNIGHTHPEYDDTIIIDAVSGLLQDHIDNSTIHFTIADLNLDDYATTVQLVSTSGILQTQIDDKANRALSNLTTTAINTSLIPDTDDSYSIGISGTRFNEGYFSDAVIVGNDEISITPTQVLAAVNTVHATGSIFPGLSYKTQPKFGFSYYNSIIHGITNGYVALRISQGSVSLGNGATGNANLHTNVSLSTPAYNFVGDNDTGLLREAADTLGFVTAATIRFSISTTAITTTLNILPSLDNTNDLGSNSLKFNTLYVNNIPGFATSIDLVTVSGVLQDQINLKSDIGHTHSLVDITDYVAPDLSGYATIVQVTTVSGFLQSAIDLKQDADVNLDYISALNLAGNTGKVIAVNGTEDGFELITVSGVSGGSGPGITDGDKGDITVSSSGVVWELDEDAILSKDLETIEQDDFILFSDSSDTGSLKRTTVSGLSEAIHKNLSLVVSGLTTGNYTLSDVAWDRENFFLSGINVVTTSTDWNLYLFVDNTYNLIALTTLQLVDKGFGNTLVNPYVNFSSIGGNIYIRYEGSAPADFIFLGESR